MPSTHTSRPHAFHRRFLPALVIAFALGSLIVFGREGGIAKKKPVFGGACKDCPWGAMAEIVREAMRPDGYDVQVCYTCSGPNAPRIVSAAKQGPPPGPGARTFIAPPSDPVDFGATAVHFLRDAYHGLGRYAGDKPMSNLRLLATIQDPLWLVVAVRADSGLTDLQQIKDKHLPVSIVGDLEADYSNAVLAFYGITESDLQSWGGRIVRSEADARRHVDVIIQESSRGLPPEFSLLHEISQTAELKYLELPEALLADMAARFALERRDIPVGFLRGVDRRIPTVARSGTVVYTRDDVPDGFAYDVARALDERQDLFAWSNNTFSYNRHTVTRAFDVPLHPGAARYYREKGYLR